MADETNNQNPSIEAQQSQERQHADPAETGEPAAQGRVFYQADVDRIVQERLARERAKADPAAPTREQELDAREAKLHCRELVADSTYPAQFIEVLDTSDFDKFRSAADKLIEAFPYLNPKAKKMPSFTTPMGGKDAPEVTKEAYSKMSYHDKLKLKNEQPGVYKGLRATK